MSLKEKINEDMKSAMRSKDVALLGTIRLILAAIKQKEVDERILVDDSSVISIIEKMLKQRNDSIEAFKKANRTDLVDKEERLDSRIESLKLRYARQYAAMESSIAGFSETGDMLTSLLDTKND